jgi:hypothetical protein
MSKSEKAYGVSVIHHVLKSARNVFMRTRGHTISRSFVVAGAVACVSNILFYCFLLQAHFLQQDRGFLLLLGSSSCPMLEGLQSDSFKRPLLRSPDFRASKKPNTHRQSQVLPRSVKHQQGPTSAMYKSVHFQLGYIVPMEEECPY